MPRLWVQTTLFLSSYLPLFVLVGLRSIGESRAVVVLCASLVGAGAVGTSIFLWASYRRSKVDVVVLAMDGRDGDVAGYLATYLLPFVTVFTGRWQDIASLGGFVGILGVVYVRSRLIYINPTLSLLGFHLARIIPATPGTESDVGAVRWPRYVLSKGRPLAMNETVSAHEVTPDLLILTLKRNV